MKLKKICFLLQSNVAGGAERVMISLANEMTKYGIDVNIIILDEKSDFYQINKSVNVVRIKESIKSKLKRVAAIEKEIRNIKPDSVISFLPMANYIGIYCCKRNNIPIIISERNDPDKYSNINKFIMKHFYRCANGIVCQSKYVKNICEKNYKIKNTIVIPNPISKNQIGEYSTKKVNKIITVGRLTEQKNQKLLINAFSKIPEINNNYSLYIYGDGPLKTDLNELIKHLNMEKKIFLMGNESEVIKKNNDASLFILPSSFEGYPNVLIEAMSNGIPSISSDFPTGCARELIKEGVNGYLFEINNEEELIIKIKIALSNKDRLNSIGINAVKIYDNNKIEVIVKNWIDYIVSIIK